eukprot:5535844-Amphidinium_carterae.1
MCGAVEDLRDRSRVVCIRHDGRLFRHPEYCLYRSDLSSWQHRATGAMARAVVIERPHGVEIQHMPHHSRIFHKPQPSCHLILCQSKVAVRSQHLRHHLLLNGFEVRGECCVE